MDIVASNWGLNDAYQTAPDHPLQLFFGDIAGRGTIDLIETYYASELQADVPRRTFNALSQAFPMLLERYPTHRSFSTARVSDILRLLPKRSESVTAAVLASMVFLNRDSHLIAVPLPGEAQFAPAFAANVADVEGDGHDDIFLSQNFFAMRPEWPRSDAGRGLWLRGNGKGQFSAMAGRASGIGVYGEQRGAALADFNGDGRVDLVVAQNGAATRLYENVGAAPGLRIRLKGPMGNPEAIGAVIQLQFGGRVGPARELHAGSGYFSQDSVIPVMGCPEPPTQIQVRWPGGKRIDAKVDWPARELFVDESGNVKADSAKLP